MHNQPLIKYRTIALVLFVMFTNSACCIFGYTTHESAVWERTAGETIVQEDASIVQSRCASQAVKQCEAQTNDNCQDIVSGKKRPRFVNPSTGVTYENPEMEEEYKQSCQVMLNNRSELVASCSSNLLRNEIASCMKQNGFHEARSEHLSCKPMSLF